MTKLSKSSATEASLRQREEVEQRKRDQEYEEMAASVRPITTTRLGVMGSDAWRDMDGFDADEEHRRFRLALKTGQFQTAAHLAANLDELMQRGGSPPVAWLGPPCMRTAEDREQAHADAVTRERTIGWRNDFC
jgi:hypothetical protein